MPICLRLARKAQDLRPRRRGLGCGTPAAGARGARQRTAGWESVQLLVRAAAVSPGKGILGG